VRNRQPGAAGSGENGTPIVSVRDLEKRFGDFVAVDRVSFSIDRGEIFGFLGPNGAGKSTTIRMLCGIITPSAGSGLVAGYDVVRQSESIKQTIGYMSQKFSLYEDLTPVENIRFYLGIYSVPERDWPERTEWALGMARLGGMRDRLTRELAPGWRQRLALACALLHRPEILFLDEPTSGVDPGTRRHFWEFIRELAGQGVTVFVTTHYMDEAEYCDRIGLIYRGELIALGTPTELKTRLMKDEVLEVLCPQPQNALTLVGKIPVVKETALFGRGLHLVVTDSEAAVPLVRDGLCKAGFEPVTVAKIIPSLEDVFVSLIEERDRAEAKQKEFSA